MNILTLRDYQDYVTAKVGGELTPEEVDHVRRAHAYCSTLGNAVVTAALLNTARRVNADPMFNN